MAHHGDEVGSADLRSRRVLPGTPSGAVSQRRGSETRDTVRPSGPPRMRAEIGVRLKRCDVWTDRDRRTHRRECVPLVRMLQEPHGTHSHWPRGAVATPGLLRVRAPVHCPKRNADQRRGARAVPGCQVRSGALPEVRQPAASSQEHAPSGAIPRLPVLRSAVQVHSGVSLWSARIADSIHQWQTGG